MSRPTGPSIYFGCNPAGTSVGSTNTFGRRHADAGAFWLLPPGRFSAGRVGDGGHVRLHGMTSPVTFCDELHDQKDRTAPFGLLQITNAARLKGGEGRTSLFSGERGKVRNRRLSSVAVGPGDGPLTERTAVARPGTRELVIMPRSRPP